MTRFHAEHGPKEQAAMRKIRWRRLRRSLAADLRRWVGGSVVSDPPDPGAGPCLEQARQATTAGGVGWPAGRRNAGGRDPRPAAGDYPTAVPVLDSVAIAIDTDVTFD
jgi:hypothetical protein